MRKGNRSAPSPCHNWRHVATLWIQVQHSYAMAPVQLRILHNAAPKAVVTLSDSVFLQLTELAEQQQISTSVLLTQIIEKRIQEFESSEKQVDGWA